MVFRNLLPLFQVYKKVNTNKIKLHLFRIIKKFILIKRPVFKWIRRKKEIASK